MCEPTCALFDGQCNTWLLDRGVVVVVVVAGVGEGGSSNARQANMRLMERGDLSWYDVRAGQAQTHTLARAHTSTSAVLQFEEV